MTDAIRLLLADDHPIVLDGLEQLFRLERDFVVLARCRTGNETLRAAREHLPDVLVLDVRMPDGDGLEVLRVIAEQRLAIRVVLLTAALDGPQLLRALELGVRGVVLKEAAPELLAEAVRAVHRGEQWLPPSSMASAVEALAARRGAGVGPTRAPLTPREIEIVRLVSSGRRNRAIAEELGISEGTVKIHLHNVYEKLGIDGRVQLALYAQGAGLGAL